MSLFDHPPMISAQNESDEPQPTRTHTRQELQQLLHRAVPRAIAALESAMANGDHAEAVKAAQIVLDRAGFGPKATVKIEDLPEDLTTLSDEDLAKRAERIAQLLKQGRTSVH